MIVSSGQEGGVEGRVVGVSGLDKRSVRDVGHAGHAEASDALAGEHFQNVFRTFQVRFFKGAVRVAMRGYFVSALTDLTDQLGSVLRKAGGAEKRRFYLMAGKAAQNLPATFGRDADLFFPRQ